MTQEHKELLKDLCARLPYGVKCSFGINDAIYEICGINPTCCGASEIQATQVKRSINGDFSLSRCKPYLFPISSISEDQKYDFYCRFIKNDCNFDDFKKFYLYNGMWRRKLLTLTSLYDIEAMIEWFHKNHIDYRGLIEKGLAIDATGLNIY